MTKALEAQFGDKMTLAQRRDITLKLIAMSLAQSRQAAPSADAGPPSPGQAAALTPLMFVLKTAGKIVSSNGEMDELSGEVFWALYPPAAAVKPVVMTATVDIIRWMISRTKLQLRFVGVDESEVANLLGISV